MLFIHPIFQLSAILLGLYVFYLGLRRFSSRHLNKTRSFLWRRHVVLGSISFVVLLTGMLFGLIMVYAYWGGFLITGTHGKVALTMAPFILFGIISGAYMNARKRKRSVLPLIHGINNLIVLLLALLQAFTGWTILSTFVLGL